MTVSDDSTGLLLIGHGTRSDVGTAQFLALADSLAIRLAPLAVEPAFLELQQPDIDAAVGRIAIRGISRLVTLPLLLFSAGHAKRDIPQQVQAALNRHGLSHTEQTQAEHLGCHPLLVELSRLRMSEAMRRVGLAHHRPNDTATRDRLASSGGPSPPYCDSCLLLVGRGSRDESATAEMHEFARLRQHELEGIRVEVAFLAMARPLLPEQLNQAACQDYRRVIVQPHLLFRGELVESIERQVAEMAVRHPEKQWIMTPPLADEPGIVTFATELLQKVILDRCRQAGIHVAALTRGD